jgi:SAM-dependent methyltransferase
MFEDGGPTFWELMVQAMSSTEHGYDLIATKFDHTPFRTPDLVLEAMAKEIGTVGSALDVCCGTGAAMKHLRPLCRERVVGLDMSQGMLDEARRRLDAVLAHRSISFVVTRSRCRSKKSSMSSRALAHSVTSSRRTNTCSSKASIVR